MGTTISGRVTVEEGDPATDAVVELHNVTDDVVTQVRVDEDARYRFHVTEGSWRLKVWDPHGRRGEARARVSTGEERDLSIRLEKGAARTVDRAVTPRPPGL
jgi:hypothetical protein